MARLNVNGKAYDVDVAPDSHRVTELFLVYLRRADLLTGHAANADSTTPSISCSVAPC